jgi:LysM repeat protein
MSTYRIKSGDTLSQLAQRNGTTVSALAKANNISNPDMIIAGKTLEIPDGMDRGGGAAAPGGAITRATRTPMARSPARAPPLAASARARAGAAPRAWPTRPRASRASWASR